MTEARFIMKTHDSRLNTMLTGQSKWKISHTDSIQQTVVAFPEPFEIGTALSCQDWMIGTVATLVLYCVFKDTAEEVSQTVSKKENAQ